MKSGCRSAVPLYSSSLKMNCFKRGLEANIRKFYAQGYSKDTLCLAMGISKEELLRIVSAPSEIRIQK